MHFFRNIDKAIGTHEGTSDLRHKMRSILSAKSKSDYYAILNELKSMRSNMAMSMYMLMLVEHSSQLVRNWAINKSNDVIAAGLNPNCSHIHRNVYLNIRSNTNSNEQTGWKNNSFGTRLDLVTAIQTYVWL